jgi:hypothetical protein
MSETLAPASGEPALPSQPVSAPITGETPAPTTGVTSPTMDTNILADAAVEPAPAADEPAAPAEEAPKEAAPVEYKDIKLPDGVATDDASVAAFAAEAAKQGIPQDKLEALIASVAPQIQGALKAPHQAWVDTQTEWQKQVMADPEIGGANFAGMKVTVAKMLDDPRFCDPGLREALNFTGAGNNPAVIRTMFKLAQIVTEGGPTATGAPPNAGKTAAQILYPNLT